MLNDATTVAIAKVFEKKAKSIRLQPGHWPVAAKVVIDLSGEIVKGDDVVYTPTVDIPMLTTLALVLEKAGFMRERAKELLIDAMTEALVLEEKGSEIVAERVKDIESAMEHVREVTAALPKKIRQGATNVSVEVAAGELTTV